MPAAAAVPATIDEYIAAFPPRVRAILRAVRRTIRAAAPGATERISYRMPAYEQGGIIVYFAAFQHHLGLFPPVRGDAALMKAVAKYAGPKGNLQFPLDEPVPHALLTRIVKARVKQLAAKAKSKAPKRR